MRTPKKQAAVRVGDNVKFYIGNQLLEGKVVEDRGGIGLNGRHLYGITIPMDPENMHIELPAALFEVVR